MSVSSISGGTNALYFKRLAAGQDQNNAQGTNQSGRPSGPPPGGFPGGQGGDGPPGLSSLPDSLKESVTSVFKDGISNSTSFQDIESKVTSAIDDYKKTDEYAALSDDQKQSIQDFADGPKRARESGLQSILGELDQAGSDTRSQILEAFSKSSSNSSSKSGSDTSSSATDQDLLTLLQQLQSQSSQAA